MPQRPPAKQAAPAETLENLSLGYNGYTDPTLTKPQMWAAASQVFSGAFGNIQRSRFANIKLFTPATGLAYSSLKYFALPGLSSYLLADLNGKLYSYDTGLNYAQTQRFNPYVDPTGVGSASLNGPWAREVLQNIVYEMNGTVKQSGRLANATTIEGFGIDAPDASPQVTINAGTSQNITSITRNAGVVTAVLAGVLTVPSSGGVGGLLNVQGMTPDPSFNGTFQLVSGNGTNTLTWNQAGQNTTPGAFAGTVNTNINKAVGRSYAWAWENANKPHVSAPSPSTQFILYNNQFGQLNLFEPGTVSLANGSAIVTGTATQFTSAWIGRSIWVNTVIGQNASTPFLRIISVQSATQMTLSANWNLGIITLQAFQIFDPQSTHIRLYETADGGATYFRVQRNAFLPNQSNFVAAGLQFSDSGNSEPPNFPFTTETSQLNNLPPPIGPFLNEYQGRLLVYGIVGASQSFFYSNQETTNIGMPQESFAPLNQVTLPIANGKVNGMLEFPGSLIIWSDKQDMFRLTGLLSDNTISTGAQQGAQIARLPYNLGMANPFACDITPLGGIWLTPNQEIWLFTDRYAPRNVGRPVQDILSTISPAQMGLARGKYFHTTNRNWFALAIPANGSSFNNMVLLLDLDLLASNGSPSYFTFDMATNSPAWWIVQPGPLVTQGSPPVSTIHPRCDAIEVVYELGGTVRLITGSTDLIQDMDYNGFAFGSEIPVPGGTVTFHAWGNDSAQMIKRPSFVRFLTNRDPATLGPDGWSFATQGIDDDFYTFASPLALAHTPGVNDTAALCGNPNLFNGESFRFSPSLFKIGGVNFVAGRRLKFTVNFPSLVGNTYQFRSVQLGFGPSPPR